MAGMTGGGVAVGLASAEQGNQQGGGLNVFNIFPLMLIPVLVYVVIAFTTAMAGGDASAFIGSMTEFQSGLCQGMANAGPDAAACRVGALHGTLVSIPLPSGNWSISTGDIILIVSLVFLFVEMIKSAGSGTSTLLNHGLSVATFLICLLLFLLVGVFATSVFFLLTLMTLVDVVAGFSITAIAARRDLGT